MFSSLFSTTAASLSISSVAICTGVSLLVGVILAFVYRASENCSRNFLLTLILLPSVVQMVIMLVNGNLGTGVAVVGAFSLIRFRSVPGTSKEICIIFLAMATGLATGMGYAVFALVFGIAISLVFLLLSTTILGTKNEAKNLKITIPENLDYTEVFDDIFDKYTKKVTLDRIKSVNLGSMFELTYSVVLKSGASQKQMIDEIRCRNGNLTIVCSRLADAKDVL